MTDDDRLRRAFRAAVDAVPPSDEPLDTERIWAAAHGELSPEETAEVVDRVARDPEAAEAWRLAVALTPPAAEVVPLRRASTPTLEPTRANRREQTEDPPARRSRAWAGATLVALAAAILLVALPLLQEGEVPPQEAPVYREAEGERLVTDAPRLVHPGQPLPLRWTPLEGATYTVTVTDQALNVLYEREGLTEAQHEVPADALGELVPGSALLWRVRADTTEGSVTSATTTLRVEP